MEEGAQVDEAVCVQCLAQVRQQRAEHQRPPRALRAEAQHAQLEAGGRRRRARPHAHRDAAAHGEDGLEPALGASGPHAAGLLAAARAKLVAPKVVGVADAVEAELGEALVHAVAAEQLEQSHRRLGGWRAERRARARKRVRRERRTRPRDEGVVAELAQPDAVRPERSRRLFRVGQPHHRRLQLGQNPRDRVALMHADDGLHRCVDSKIGGGRTE